LRGLSWHLRFERADVPLSGAGGRIRPGQELFGHLGEVADPLRKMRVAGGAGILEQTTRALR
jgi:hypothetical protein